MAVDAAATEGAGGGVVSGWDSDRSFFSGKYDSERSIFPGKKGEEMSNGNALSGCSLLSPSASGRGCVFV